MRFYEKIYSLRKKAGMTQIELSGKLMVSRQAVSKWEMGLAIPDIENMIAISKLFNVTIDYLISDSDEQGTDEQDGNPSNEKEFSPVENLVRYVRHRILIAIGIVIILGVIGRVTSTSANMLGVIIFGGAVFFVYYAIKVFMFDHKHIKKQK